MQRNEIYTLYGGDGRAMAAALLRHAKIGELIGGKHKKIGIKPNLVVARPAEEGATTHPEVAAGVVETLLEEGYRDISIIEGAWVGERTARAFEACGYTALARRYGVKLVDTQKDKSRRCRCGGMEIAICESALAVDFMFNLPVMKGHCQTGITCALKNNKGVIPDAEKRRFHTMGLHKPIACLNTVAKSDFILVDSLCGDLDFEEGGSPMPAGRLFAARDAVLCDAFAAALMGYRVDEVPYIRMAEALGVGSADLAAARITQLNSGEAAPAAAMPARKAQGLAANIEENGACSACYAALVRALSRMEAEERAALGKVCVGQGFAGRGGALGVGRCTAGFARTVAGCPPTASDILALLRDG